MFQYEGARRWDLTRTVVVRLNHADARRVVDQVGLGVADIQPQSQCVLPRHERQAGNVADEHLRPDMFLIRSIWLKHAVGGEDALSEDIVEAEAEIEAGGRGRQIEMDPDFQS